MLDHVLQRGIKLIQRVNFCQIHVAVPDGNIAFLVHVAKIAQFNLIGLILRGKMDGAHRIVQTVHAVIGDLFNDEGHAKRFELLQHFVDGILIHRECLIFIIEPGLVLMEGQRGLSALPTQGLDIIAGNLQHDLAGGFDLFPFFFRLGHRKGGDAGNHQNAQHRVKPFRPFHVAPSFDLE